ncbi:MAG: hypothetical protein HYZ54_08430 [Ignavibacteriae bacterium]|nr:hypothetical protein [Ignavibacteriota bacterium]
MPSFDPLFHKVKEEPVLYNGKELFRIDKFPVSNGDTLLVSIEKVNSDCRQGVTIDVTGSVEIDGEIHKKGKGLRVLFWAGDLIKPIKVFTKKDFVHVYNIWEDISYQPSTNEKGETVWKEFCRPTYYWMNGAAMMVEEIETGRRYYCNDGAPDENFDDIVFTVDYKIGIAMAIVEETENATCLRKNSKCLLNNVLLYLLLYVIFYPVQRISK